MPGQEGANLAQNLAGYVQTGPVEVAKGAGDAAQGNVKQGLNRMFSGAGTTAAPVTPFLAAGAPVTFARAIAGGYVGSKVGEAGAQIAGGDKESQQLAGNVGNLLGGFTAGAGLPRAFLETPAKTIVKNPALMQAVLKVLEPRKALVEALKSGLKDALEEPSGATEGTAAGPVSSAPAPVKPSSAEPTVPNATYLRPDVKSLSQQPPPAPKPSLLSGIREHEFLLKVQDELNRQGGNEEAQAELDKWIEAHNQQSPGAKGKQLRQDYIKRTAEAKTKTVPGEDQPRVPDPNSETDQETLLMKSLKKYGFQHDPVTGRMVKIHAAGAD